MKNGWSLFATFLILALLAEVGDHSNTPVIFVAANLFEICMAVLAAWKFVEFIGKQK